MTFFATLASKDVSIVSPFSGTTRDVIETTFNICGQSITICDTAGLRELSELTSDQIIEKEGMKRAKIKAKTCDIIMFVTDSKFNYDELSELREVVKENPKAIIIKVMNKVDLVKDEEERKNFEKEADIIKTSCVTDSGIDELIEEIGKVVNFLIDQNDPSSFTFLNQRHNSILTQVNFLLDEAIKNMYTDLAVVGHLLQKAAKSVSELTGHISNDDILNVIFSKFCIGK